MSKYLSGVKIFNSTGTVTTSLTDTAILTSAAITNTSTILSSSSTTGGLVTSGGIGVSKNIWVGTSYSGAIFASSNVKGVVFNSPAITLTDNVLSAGTITNVNSSTLNQVTMAASNAITATNAATLYIAGPPIAGSNVSITNSYAIQVSTGKTIFSDSSSSSSTTTGALVVSGGVGIGGNLYVGGTIFGTINGTINTTSISLGASSNQIILNSGNTLTLTAPTFSAARIYTIADAGSDATFIMSTFGSAQTIAGGLTSSDTLTASNGFTLTTGALNLTSTSGAVSLTGTSFTTNTAMFITATTNQLRFGVTNTVTLTSPAPAASRIYTIPDAGGAANFIMSTFGSAQTIAGGLTSSGTLTASSGLTVTSGNVDFSASSGTFSTPSGAVTIGPGATTITGILNISGNSVLTPLSITGTSSPQTLSGTAGGSLIILNTGGNITLNLPASPANGTTFTIINIANFTVTLSTNSGTVYFDGNSSITTINMSQYDRIKVVFYGTNWFTT